MASSILHAFQTVTELLKKYDGRDKVLATLQYVLMFLAAGQPGKLLVVQKALAGSRKPFRIAKPLELLSPAIYFKKTDELTVESLLDRLKSIFMAGYFGFDHLVWLGNVGVYQDKTLLGQMGRYSMYGWCLGSLTTLLLQTIKIQKSQKKIKEYSKQTRNEETRNLLLEERKMLKKSMVVLVHSMFQTLLSASLANVLELSPRFTGALGSITSALAVYQQLPPIKTKSLSKTA